MTIAKGISHLSSWAEWKHLVLCRVLDWILDWVLDWILDWILRHILIAGLDSGLGTMSGNSKQLLRVSSAFPCTLTCTLTGSFTGTRISGDASRYDYLRHLRERVARNVDLCCRSHNGHHPHASALTGVWVELLKGVAAARCSRGALAGARVRIEPLAKPAHRSDVAGTRALTLGVVEGERERARLLHISAHRLAAAGCVTEGLTGGAGDNGWALALAGLRIESLRLLAGVLAEGGDRFAAAVHLVEDLVRGALHFVRAFTLAGLRAEELSAEARNLLVASALAGSAVEVLTRVARDLVEALAAAGQ